jgi:hypothetical protein
MDDEWKLNALASEPAEGEARCLFCTLKDPLRYTLLQSVLSHNQSFEQFCLGHYEDFDYVGRHYTFE